jgi:hypothetical protein
MLRWTLLLVSILAVPVTALAARIGADAIAPSTIDTLESSSGTPIGVGSLRYVTDLTTNGHPMPINGTSQANTSLFGNRAYINQQLTSSQQFTDLAITFVTPVAAAGAWVSQVTNFLNRSPASLTAMVYDSQHNLLDAMTFANPAAAAAPVFVGFAFAEGVARIEFQGGNAGFFGIDNVTFGAYSVPEPGALPLAVVSFGALCARAARLNPRPRFLRSAL